MSETKTITIDGLEYVVQDYVTEESALANPKFAARHAQAMEERIAALVAPTEEELSREDEKSGVKDALLAGLSNDQGYQISWLAGNRFPEILERGQDPSNYYFLDENNDISYVDPYTGKPTKEFDDNFFGTLMNTYGMVGPTAQFLTEAVPATVAMGLGAFFGGIPGAMVGGAGGSAGGATIAGASRMGISAAFDGPPLNVAQMKEDLAYSTAFGAIPIGVGGAKGLGNIYKSVSGKFPDGDGRSVLESIMREGGNTVDEKIAFAKSKYDVTLTRGEAQEITSNAGMLQRYLQMQGGSQKIWDFYQNRALQIEEVAEEFFDGIIQGKYPKGSQGRSASTYPRLSGRMGLEPEVDVAKAAAESLKTLADRRMQRAAPVYKNAYELDVTIDVSDVASQIKSKLDDPNFSGPSRAAYKSIYDGLLDKTRPIKDEAGKVVDYELRDSTELLHLSLTNSFKDTIETVIKEGRGVLKYEISALRSQISKKLKEANPEFKRANEIYDPSKGHLEILNNSAVHNFANVAKLGGERAAGLAKRLFNGTSTVRDAKLLRRMISTEDPQVWQNFKGYWLRTQLDEAVADSTTVLGVPNKFLSKIGLRGKALRGNTNEIRATVRARGKRAKVFEEILGPEEFQVFKDVVELMQATSYIATQGGSPTQPLLAIQSLLEKQSGGASKYATSALRSIIEIPQRLLVRGFDDVSKATLNFQREVYEDRLIQAMIDPELAAQLAKEMKAVKPLLYFATQAVARGTPEVLDSLAFEADEVSKDGGIRRSDEGIDVLKRAQEATEAEKAEADAVDRQRLESSINSFEVPTMGEMQPLPAMSINPAMSPTLLPNPKDRELAMRLQPAGAGIAGLI